MPGVALRPRVAAVAHVRQESFEHSAQEERHPHAFAAALPAHPVHPVVPVAAAEEREAVGADFERAVERAAAVLVEIGCDTRPARREERFVLARAERARGEERNTLGEDRAVACCFDVLRGCVRQPQQVVRKTRAQPAARWRMPPVQHVAFDELVRGVEQDLLPRERRIHGEERQRVLELIAESECAAGLIEGRARPQPAGQRLIGEPAVHHQVDRRERRLDSQAGVALRPECARLGLQLLDGPRRAQPPQLDAHSTGRARLAQHHGDVARAARWERELDALGEAGIESGPGTAVERLAGRERRRSARTAAAPQERLAIGGEAQPLPGRAAQRGREGHSIARAPERDAAREERARCRVAPCDDRAAARGLGAEHEARVRCERKPPRPAVAVGDADARQLEARMRRHDDQRVHLEAAARVAEAAVAEAVAGLVRVGAGARTGQRRPDVAARLVPHVESLAMRIAHWIVRPRRQAMLAAVTRPCAARAGLAHDRAEWLR